jgi:hypothetical protein
MVHDGAVSSVGKAVHEVVARGALPPLLQHQCILLRGPRPGRPLSTFCWRRFAADS